MFVYEKYLEMKTQNDFYITFNNKFVILILIFKKDLIEVLSIFT